MLQIKSRCVLAAVFTLAVVSSTVDAQDSFRRVATFPVFLNEDITTQSVASSVAANASGELLIYTDSVQGKLGFVDISEPADPVPAGTLAVGGTPIAVRTAGWTDYALVAVQDGASPGWLQIVDLDTRDIVRTIELSGRPTGLSVDPQAKFAAVSIDTTGEVLIVDLITPFPLTWPTRTATLAGQTNTPQPQAVSISQQGRCAVALTAENHVTVLDLNHQRGLRILLNCLLPDVINGAKIDGTWSAGTVDLPQMDVIRNSLVELNAELASVARNPVSLQWTGPNTLASANNASRGMSLLSRQGHLQFDLGNQFEHLAARIGHFPEHRVELLGTEPNAVLSERYKNTNYLFLSSKTAGMVGVYTQKGNAPPAFRQVLPTPRSPRGLLAIPQRNLFVVSSDEDNRVGKFRAAISLYELAAGPANYPTLVSENRPDGTPIPWAGISGLCGDPNDSGTMYAVYDNRYRRSCILKIDLTETVPTIVEEIVLFNNGAIPSLPLGTIDIDPEGVALRPNGGFWVASEGNTPPDVPGIINDQLLQVAANGVVEKEILLPASLRANPFRFGFEGVTNFVDDEGNETVYVCLQRPWSDDPAGFTKIAKYDVASEEWTFALYPLDAATSPYPGTNWVGLSEITALDANTLLILERDNQAGTDARIKRLYLVDMSDVAFLPHGEELEKVEKSLLRDILPDMEAPNGFVLEKVEGVAVLSNGDVYIAVDNDGTTVFGENQLINLGDILP